MLMAKVRIFITKILNKNDLLFPALMWLASRMLIWAAMLVVAPNLPTPADGITPRYGWEIFDAWDSVHYRAIATSGYEYADDGKQHNIAFFPMFPLLLRFVMAFGLRFEVAGTIVNNLAFFAALYCLYFWAKQHYGKHAARWATAVLAWCPLSMFAGVIYTEGLYLLLSTAALQAFDRQEYGKTAVWGAMATATRPTGMALIPALAIASFGQRRPLTAYVASFATAMGLVVFSIYCTITFGDPLAFIHAQKGWRPTFGFDWQGWWNMLMQIAVGTTNWTSGTLKDPLHPLLLLIFVSGGYYLSRRKHLISLKVIYGFCALILLWLLLADDWLIYNFLNALMFFSGSYFLWRSRLQLTPVTVTYGFCGLGLLLASGGTISLGRLSYGIVSLSLALGVLLSRHPRWGYLTMSLFVILLVRLAVGFAQQIWVG